MATSETRVVLECSCSALAHSIRLSYWPPESQGEGYDAADLYLDALWGRQEPWWRRLWTAALYVLRGVDCNFGGAMEHVFTPETARQAQDLVGRYLASRGEVP